MVTVSRFSWVRVMVRISVRLGLDLAVGLALLQIIYAPELDNSPLYLLFLSLSILL